MSSAFRPGQPRGTPLLRLIPQNLFWKKQPDPSNLIFRTWLACFANGGVQPHERRGFGTISEGGRVRQLVNCGASSIIPISGYVKSSWTGLPRGPNVEEADAKDMAGCAQAPLISEEANKRGADANTAGK